LICKSLHSSLPSYRYFTDGFLYLRLLELRFLLNWAHVRGGVDAAVFERARLHGHFKITRQYRTRTMRLRRPTVILQQRLVIELTADLEM